MESMELRLKRAYEEPAADDGRRILVDRLWPRGVKKADARIDFWAREVSPSTDLRKRFRHDSALWDEFRRLYFRELDANPEGLAKLRDALADASRATLVYAARDEHHNNAAALAEYLNACR